MRGSVGVIAAVSSGALLVTGAAAVAAAGVLVADMHGNGDSVIAVTASVRFRLADRTP